MPFLHFTSRSYFSVSEILLSFWFVVSVGRLPGGKKRQISAPNTDKRGAALPPNIQQTFCFCVEKSLGRWDGGVEIYYQLWRRSFFNITTYRLVKEPADHFLPRPLHQSRIAIGQSGLKVDKPSSSWDLFFFVFLWVCSCSHYSYYNYLSSRYEWSSCPCIGAVVFIHAQTHRNK